MKKIKETDTGVIAIEMLDRHGMGSEDPILKFYLKSRDDFGNQFLECIGEFKARDIEGGIHGSSLIDEWLLSLKGESK